MYPDTATSERQDMGYHGHEKPFPDWFPAFLIGLAILGFAAYMLLT